MKEWISGWQIGDTAKCADCFGKKFEGVVVGVGEYSITLRVGKTLTHVPVSLAQQRVRGKLAKRRTPEQGDLFGGGR